MILWLLCRGKIKGRARVKAGDHLEEYCDNLVRNGGMNQCGSGDEKQSNSAYTLFVDFIRFSDWVM